MPHVQLHNKTINNHLPMELLRDIFLTSVEANKTKPGQLGAVCRYWRATIIGIPIVWSTLRVGIWTEREQVAIWLKRGFPLKVVIDAKRGSQRRSNTRPYAVLQDILATTDKWHELTIFSFPSEYTGSELNFRVARPMKLLRTLLIDAGYIPSRIIGCLLDLVPVSLPELRLYSSAKTASFLQPHPHWLPVLQNLTVFIIDASNIPGELDVLPGLTRIKQLHMRFSHIPNYSLDVYLPLVRTLQQLELDHSTFSWMRGRTFAALKECSILWPREVSRDLSMSKGSQVDMPVCKTLKWRYTSISIPSFLSCPNVQTIEWRPNGYDSTFDVKSLHDFLLNCPRLQMLEITTGCYTGLASLILYIFCDAWEQGVWHDIKSVELCVIESMKESHLFRHIGGDLQHYGRWWKKFTISGRVDIFIRAST